MTRSRFPDFGRAWLCACLACLFLSLAPAFAQTADPPDKRLDQVRLQLDQVQASLQRADQGDSALKALRVQLDGLGQMIQDVITELAPKLEAVRQRLEQLKPKAPDKAAADKPATPPAIAPTTKPDSAPDAAAAEMAEQDKAFTDIDASLRRARSLAVETEQTLGEVLARRRTLFTRALFEQSSSLLNPGLWRDVIRDLPRDWRAIQFMGGDWLSAITAKLRGWRLPLLATLIGVLLLLTWPAARVARRIVAGNMSKGQPDRLRKILSAVTAALVMIVIPFAFVVLCAQLGEAFDLNNQRLQPLFRALSAGILRIAVMVAVWRAAFNPGSGRWRLVPVSDATAKYACNFVLQVAIIVSLTKVAEALVEVIAAGLAVVAALRGVGALLVALAIGIGVRKLARLTQDDDSERPSAASLLGPLRLLVWVAAALVVGAVLFGYIALGSFLADQIVLVANFGVVVYLLVTLTEEGFASALQPKSGLGRALVGSLGMRPESLQQLAILLTGAAHLALYSMAALLALTPWGLQSDDLMASLRAAFFGFQLGDLSVSPSNILAALLMFALSYGVSRAILRWLDIRFLPLTQLDKGLRNSIRTSLGYLALLLSASVALAHLGLSFEKLALIASALSVGIGLGLQSIASNFASGLILLWERAIRVGDWIVVGDDQGYVRRINVRSTEIETFDRLTVIVPNSNLISGVVKNWVRGDRIGRVRITMTLANDCDIGQARDLLIACAKAHEAVLRIPAPSVFFGAIGVTTSVIDLFCFVADVENSARVRSDLLFEVHEKFKAAGLLNVNMTPPVVVNLQGVEVGFGRKG